jgi:cell division transport system permease protein
MIAGYAARHVQALLGSAGRLARAPFATLLTALVIALALATPLALEVFVANTLAATGSFSGAVDMSVYLRTGVPLARAQQLARGARGHPGVAAVEVISADDALQEFRRYSGFGAALGALPGNPLPNLLHVRPASDSSSAAALDALRAWFAAWPEVDMVQIDAGWVRRFNALVELLRRLLWVAGALLSVAVLAVVGNTIRLEIGSRRPEIEVVKLVGGSDAFVRRPFLYTGALYGACGAALAWAVVEATVLALRAPVAALAAAYGSRYALSGPGLHEAGATLAAGCLLGWLGAWVAAARHLRRIEPRD